jgi:hypothetical protein
MTVSCKISTSPFNRHPREGGDPAFFKTISAEKSWTPASAGVTIYKMGTTRP